MAVRPPSVRVISTLVSGLDQLADCRLSAASRRQVSHLAGLNADCLHGFKSTIIAGASYVTSYDTQPSAVAPSASKPSGLEAFRVDGAVLAAKERGVYFDVGHGAGAHMHMKRAVEWSVL